MTDNFWLCPYCGDSYQFSTHPGCLRKALRERDAARALLRECLELIDRMTSAEEGSTFTLAEALFLIERIEAELGEVGV